MSTHIRLMVAVWLGLLLLLALTVGLSFLPLGDLSPLASIGIAAAKAALVVWFFMHLRQDSGIIRLVALAAVIWIAILLTLPWIDFSSRNWL